jgi:hypothetical protein
MNPEDRETLFTIAEVAVAVAGFASIVSVLASRSGRDDPGIDTTRLRIMLFTSLSAISLCFVPVLSFRFGLSSDTAWRLCGAALLLGTGVPFVRNLLDVRSVRDAGVTPGAGIIVTALATYIIPGALSVGLLVGRAEAPAYIAGVLVLLAGSGIAFARLVLSYSSRTAAQQADEADVE